MADDLATEFAQAFYRRLLAGEPIPAPVGALAVSHSNPNVIYAGVGVADNQFFSSISKRMEDKGFRVIPVNPKEAGKEISEAGVEYGKGWFDSLNPFIIRGQAVSAVSTYVFETLMARNKAEPFSLYGLLARSIEVAPDRSRVTFNLDPRAKFSDGTPVTSADVVFSLETLRDHGRPNHRTYYAKVDRIETPDDHTVTFHLADGDRELVLELYGCALGVFAEPAGGQVPGHPADERRRIVVRADPVPALKGPAERLLGEVFGLLHIPAAVIEEIPEGFGMVFRGDTPAMAINGSTGQEWSLAD